jgi:hypothetical protein
MGISTETEALIEFHKAKIKNDQKQKEQVAFTMEGFSFNLPDGEVYNMPNATELVSWYDNPSEKIDKKIYDLNVQIVDLQNQILAVGQSANACGCGGAIGFTTTGIPFFIGINTITAYADTVTYRGWAYTSPNPFEEINGTLTESNSGIGTETLTGVTPIGVYYGNVGVARTNINISPICPGVTTCTQYSTQIAALEAQIAPLQAERNALLPKVNYVKSERGKYKIREFGYNVQMQTLTNEINSSNSLVNFLQDPANEEWLT